MPGPPLIDGDRCVDDRKGIDVCHDVSVQPIATIAASCPPLLEGTLGEAEAQRLSQALKAIADPARLRLISLIQGQPGGEACVCHLTEPLGLSQPTVSHHLKVLLQAGLVEREQRGSWAYYRVVPEPLAALRAVLA
jgi:ArsR family transcriptional regulator